MYVNQYSSGIQTTYNYNRTRNTVLKTTSTTVTELFFRRGAKFFDMIDFFSIFHSIPAILTAVLTWMPIPFFFDNE